MLGQDIVIAYSYLSKKQIKLECVLRLWNPNLGLLFLNLDT